MEHQVDHRDVDESFACFRQPFVVLRKAAALVQPGKRPLHNPALPDHMEALRLVAPPDDLQEPVKEQFHLLHQFPSIAPIGVYTLKSRPPLALAIKKQQCAVAVLYRRGQHHHAEDEPERVYKEMAFCAFDLFARVVAALAAPFAVVLEL